MERFRVIEEISSLVDRLTVKAPSFKANRWGILVLTVGSFLIAACDSNNVPVLATATPMKPTEGAFAPNKPNVQGYYAESAQAGTCAPFKNPIWTEYSQLEARCVDPSNDFSKEVRSYIRGVRGGDISVIVDSPWDSKLGISQIISYGLVKDIPNPINGDCTIKVANTGQQPQFEQTCENNTKGG